MKKVIIDGETKYLVESKAICEDKMVYKGISYEIRDTPLQLLVDFNGVEVGLNATVFWVRTDTFAEGTVSAGKVDPIATTSKRGLYVYFTTVAAAKEYVKWNKPCGISLNAFVDKFMEDWSKPKEWVLASDTMKNIFALCKVAPDE